MVAATLVKLIQNRIPNHLKLNPIRDIQQGTRGTSDISNI
jgi:hypothetical protein